MPHVKVWTVVLVAAAALTLSCGGDSGPTVTIVVEAEISEHPRGADSVQTMEDIAEVLRRRVNEFGGSASATIEGQNRIVLEVRGVEPGVAENLVGKTALLEFRAPVINDAGLVVCSAADGTEFAVPGNLVVEGECIGGTDADGNALVGDATWTPATATDGSGVERVLTGDFVEPGGAEVRRGAPCIPACVVLEFTGEGSLLFEQVTNRLVNFPLGIFLDEELFAAPNVAQGISGGAVVIAGLQDGEAETLAAQVNAGPLPVPITLVSVESDP